MTIKTGRTPDESRARQGVELIAIRWRRFPRRRVASRPAVEFIHEIVTPDGSAVRRVSGSRAYKWATVWFFIEAKEAQHSVSGACIYGAHDAGELYKVSWTTKDGVGQSSPLTESAKVLPVYDLHELAAELDQPASLSDAGIRAYVLYRRDQLAGKVKSEASDDMADDFLFERLVRTGQVMRWLGHREEGLAVDCLAMFCRDNDIGDVDKLDTVLAARHNAESTDCKGDDDE